MLVRERGFTIMELMVVITVLGVLIAIAAPSFREAFATQRIKTAASDIHLSLVRARSEAVKRNTNIIVSAPSGWQAGWTVSGDVETHGALGNDITISGPTSITYTANGRPTGAVAISLTSTRSTTKRCVRVGLNGQPMVRQEPCT